MKRDPKRWPDSVKMINEIIRPNPFLQSKDKNFDGPAKIRRRYGKDGDLVIVRGRLYEEDRGTLIAFLELTEETKGELEFKLPDIAKQKGITNPYSESVLGPIRESIDRLLKAEIQLNLGRPSRKKKLRGRFIFLEGYLDSDDCGSITVGNYLQVIRDLCLGFSYIRPSIYFSFRSQIARALYVYLNSQKFSHLDKGEYTIRLSKICNYLNYDMAGRPWWQVWPIVENALKQLKKAGIIGAYERNSKKFKRDGGLITIYGPGKKPVKSKPGKVNKTGRTVSYVNYRNEVDNTGRTGRTESYVNYRNEE